MSEIEKSIERIKGIVTTLADLLKDIDEERERDRKEFDRRITTLEYAYTRIIEHNKTKEDFL